MAQLIEDYVPVVKYNGGISTALPVTITGDLTVTGTTNIGGMSLTDLTATGNTILGNAVSDTLTVTGATTITSTSADALTVGANGATNPVLKVAANTASVATGLSITGAAAAGGVAVAVLSSGAAENLTINAKGTGTLTLNNVATGNIVLGAAATGVSLSVTGDFVAKSGTAVPASAGAVAAGAPITMFTSGPSIYVTSDAPSFSAVKGSICINTGGSSTSTRLYVNNGTTNWVAITTAS